MTDPALEDDSTQRAALTLIASWGCENFTSGIGSCYRWGRSPTARYLADCCCAPCIAHHALTATP